MFIKRSSIYKENTLFLSTRHELLQDQVPLSNKKLVTEGLNYELMINKHFTGQLKDENKNVWVAQYNLT